MGLAAAQARLLTITARKADCEFASMSLSHQKLALSRDMENVSNDYQNALNSTKLVYDYYGSGDSDIAVDYDLLMTPSVYNDYYPKTITDSKNRVILNPSLAAAARAAGIPAEGLTGTPSSDVRNAFVEALASTGVITPAKAAAIQSVTYGNTIGLGATTNVTQSMTQISYDDFLNYLQTYGTDTTRGSSSVTFTGAKDKTDTVYEQVYKGGSIVAGNDPSTANISLYELLTTDDVALVYETVRSEQTPILEAAQLQKEVANDVLKWMSEEFMTVLGGVNANDNAIQYAYNAVFDLLYPNSDLNSMANSIGYGGSDTDFDETTEYKENIKGYDISDTMEAMGTKVSNSKEDARKMSAATVADKSKGYLGIVYTAKDKEGCHDDGNDRTKVAVNLSNLAQVFLTAYVEFQEGIENTSYSYNRGSIDQAVLYDPEYSDFQFTIAGQTDVESDEDNLYANFYDALFNQICTNGWTENPQIENVEYMTDLFKNGLAFISSIAEDGYYYQGSYSTDRSILEVSDDSAIAVAEAKYNTEKTKIENKEDTIDMKMKNLDTEISSLTTEYESTKQIVTKAIEKSFKRYEA